MRFSTKRAQERSVRKRVRAIPPHRRSRRPAGECQFWLDADGLTAARIRDIFSVPKARRARRKGKLVMLYPRLRRRSAKPLYTVLES